MKYIFFILDPHDSNENPQDSPEEKPATNVPRFITKPVSGYQFYFVNDNNQNNHFSEWISCAWRRESKFALRNWRFRFVLMD